ncbi:hypothetical protein E2562_018943 [Oryza meyeriana var. granulata]|uniref:Uncharacterized protein n=1 Tax=Oryza meyeriana var. granulata TaxID=110450 RepID=A0A6G1DKF1_9ORYZ|nr:hypothetical protein E2562_018943 [Oryza meyeriana var. granulata]
MLVLSAADIRAHATWAPLHDVVGSGNGGSSEPVAAAARSPEHTAAALLPESIFYRRRSQADAACMDEPGRVSPPADLPGLSPTAGGGGRESRRASAEEPRREMRYSRSSPLQVDFWFEFHTVSNSPGSSGRRSCGFPPSGGAMPWAGEAATRCFE